MDEHGEFAILTDVEVKVSEYTPGLAFLQVADRHAQRLFVLEDVDPAIAEGLYAINAGWDAVRNGVALVVLFDVHGGYIEGRRTRQVDGFVLP